MTRHNCTIYVQTGDQKGASTDANVYIILYDKKNTASPKYKLDNFFRDDFKCGAIDKFPVLLPSDFGQVETIEIWRDSYGLSDDWYIDIIKVEQLRLKKTFIFPVFRWIEAESSDGHNHYRIMELDTILPQFDTNREQREKEIERKRESYRMKYQPGLPILVSSWQK